ncbi:hypothetical protein TrRE_jg4054, partial [Triparma retinervis]
MVFFYQSHKDKLHDPDCPLHVYQELSHRLHCVPSVPPSKTFHFVHSPYHYDSPEFPLLRAALLHYGYKECWSTHKNQQSTDLTWVLGHARGTRDGYELVREKTAGRRGTNCMLGMEEWGNKDKIDTNLR